ncbi:MAG: sulfite exporter TauE/SafE family protein [Bdellovibrionales bacterium]
MDLMNTILGAAGFIAYFIESVFGFGGTVIFLGLSGLGVDVKTLIYISIYGSAVASLTIIAYAWRDIAWGHFRRIFMLALPGIVIGTLLIETIDSIWLLKLFAVFLIFYGCQGLFFATYKPPAILNNLFVAAGGLLQGLFSTGGPFVLMGYKDRFANKSELRAVMAVFFLLANAWRFVQGAVTGSDMTGVITSYWWVALPIIAGVIGGHYIHLRISEKQFRQGILILLLAVGVGYLFR